ncbi:MAG: sugar ABC transporter permease [Candidatus Rokubacteria bacterium]|nr:sugar ABC transporter permease [Candidatus Rokubacteria bacterium]
MTGRERALRRRAWLMTAPALAFLALLTVYPALWVLWLSLQERIPIFDIARFVGFRHYAFLLGDSRFLGALATTLVFTVTSVALELTARIFEWLYHPAAGLVNYVLGGAALNWLGDPRLALPAVVLADVWRTMPFVAVLAYARLLGIPAELYEAAHVDGAGRVATLTRVTLPLLRRVLGIAVLFRTLDALRAFDLMFVLTGGGPANTTETLTLYAYRGIFQMLQFGFGAAIGVIVFALVMTVAWLYLRLLPSEDEAA